MGFATVGVLCTYLLTLSLRPIVAWCHCTMVWHQWYISLL